MLGALLNEGSMRRTDDPLHVNWTRYWVKHDGRFQPDSLGYGQAPSSYRGIRLQPDVFAFEELDAYRCLALMGEPGSGKSYAVDSIYEGLRLAPNVALIELDRVDGTIAELRNKLANTKAALERGEEATLFLDAFEECPVPNFAKTLPSVLEELPRERLRLRLACRSASWTRDLADPLRRLWGSDSTEAVEILRLTRADVLTALGRVAADAEGLIVRLEQRDLVALLSSPMTLRMLMDLHVAGKPITNTSRADLYRSAMKLLLHTDRSLNGLSTQQRIAVASRMAAATVFCNRPIIHRDPDTGGRPATEMAVGELLGKTEPAEGGALEVREPCVREVLALSGLFNSRGLGKLGWVHTSYAEYLASEYVREHRLPYPALAGLLRLHAERGPLVAGLQGVVGWILLNSEPALQRNLVARSPTTVLRSDVQALPEALREALVEQLLAEAASDVLDLRSFEIRSRLNRLGHAGLAAQLIPYIENAAGDVGQRVLAVRIALACRLDELAPRLAQVALRADDMRVRIQAADAVAEMADATAHQALRPLFEGLREDVDDELKGIAGTALWPRHLATVELFKKITKPKNGSLSGRYAKFLRDHVPEHLQNVDLPTALDWVLRRDAKRTDGRAMRRIDGLVEAIIRRGLARLDDPSILERMTEVALRNLTVEGSLLGRHGYGDDVPTLTETGRRRLIEAVAPQLQAARRLFALVSARPALVETSDIPWLVERVRGDGEEVQLWRELLLSTLSYFQSFLAPCLEELVAAARTLPQLTEELRRYVGPVELRSKLASEMRASHAQQKEWSADAARARDEQERWTRATLEAILQGDLQAFWNLPEALGVHNGDFNLEPTVLPGWKALGAQARDRIGATALRFVQERDDVRDKWLGTNTFYYDAHAGFRALRVLCQDPQRASELSPEVVRRWVGAVVGSPAQSESERKGQAELVDLARRLAPDALLDVLRTWLSGREHAGAYELRAMFPAPWDDELAATIGGIIAFGPEARRVPLLEALFEGAPATAEALAWAIVAGGVATDAVRRGARRLLLTRSSPASRSRILDELLLPSSIDRKQVLKDLADWSEEERGFMGAFSEMELSKLFASCTKEFPKHGDMGDVRGVGYFRNRLLNELAARNTEAAVAALQYAIDELPALQYLRRLKHDTEERVAAANWSPPTIAELVRLAADTSRRFVETAEELRAVVVESLARFQRQLNEEETPLAEFLWNVHTKTKEGDSKFEPKDETALSNLIKRHLVGELSERGIIVNREVEVSRPKGPGVGRRTDIHVDAKPAGEPGGATLKVVVEVKKCSNQERDTAIAAQLVGSYLKPLGVRNGVFVVAYYDCAVLQCCRGKTREAIETGLSSQATAVAPDYAVTVVVLDASLPPSMLPSADKASRPKAAVKDKRAPAKRGAKNPVKKPVPKATPAARRASTSGSRRR